MTNNNISKDEKIRRLSNPHWIKYIQCKRCKKDYEIKIANQPCYVCGGYEFEQFDLVLYPMPKECLT